MATEFETRNIIKVLMHELNTLTDEKEALTLALVESYATTHVSMPPVDADMVHWNAYLTTIPFVVRGSDAFWEHFILPTEPCMSWGDLQDRFDSVGRYHEAAAIQRVRLTYTL